MGSSVLESSAEKTYGFKLMRLIVDGGTEALRNIFLNIHPNNLQHVLATHYPTLLPLFKPQRIITQPQWDKLYPHPPRIPDIQEFDISILAVLLRNICSLSAPSTGKWNVMPSPTNKTLEDDIVRIRFFRNNFFGHVPGTAVSRLDFEARWVEVSSALVRLGLSKVEIARLKAEECGEEEVNRVREKWNESESKTVVKLDEIKLKLDQLGKMLSVHALSHTLDPQEEPARETPASWKWEKKSIIHRQKFIDLHEHAKTHPNEIKEVNGVRVCCTEKFLLGWGCDGTRVYVGLAKDGVEKAVKRLPRDCSSLAEQEKKIFNERSTMKSNHVVNYRCLVDQDGNEHLYLILDLCEETLEDFVKRSSGTDLITCAPDIIQQILRGLADLHRDPKPILHRDLKPSNILRDIDGNWLLADFGISRILTEDMTTHVSKSRGTEFWKAVESCSSKSQSDEVCYMKKSDIQVAGMVAFYIITKGGHPYGEKPDRLRNLLHGKPVGLDTLKDDAARDVIAWMLSRDPKDRPSAEEALKHPYLQPPKQQFKMLCKVGKQREIKTEDVESDVVRMLNSDPNDWRIKMEPDVLRYLSTDCLRGRRYRYRPSWTDCLRLIRQVKEHWEDHPRPRAEIFYIVGNPQEFFLNIFPSLPVEVHRIIRSCDWKERDDLKEYFI